MASTDKYRLQLRIVKNVGASKTATIELPVGPRYHYIQAQHGYSAGTNTIAGATANILDSRMKVNDRVQRYATGAQLRDLNILNGTAYDCTGVPNTSPGVTVPFFLAEPWRTDEIDQDALAWRTSGWQNFYMEIDLGTATSPTLTAYAVIDNLQAPLSKYVGIVKWTRQNIVAAGTKFDEVLNVPAADWLQVASFYPDSGGSNAATQVDLHRDKELIHELTSAVNTGLLTNFSMTPAASGRTSNLYDMVLDHDGLLASAIQFGTLDAIATVYAGGAMSGTIICMLQHIGNPG